MTAPAYIWPPVRPSAWSDFRGWALLTAKCWLATGLVVGFSAGCYLGLFLAVRAVL